METGSSKEKTSKENVTKAEITEDSWITYCEAGAIKTKRSKRDPIEFSMESKYK